MSADVVALFGQFRTELYAAGGLLGVLAAWWVSRKLRAAGRRLTPAVVAAGIAAVGCTAYSADTSWRFATHYLDMGSHWERAAMFAAAELALFANALMARQNLHGPDKTPGVPGVLVWVITGVQVIPAYAESGPVGGTVRAVVGPVLAALMWHLAMGIELRHRKPDAASSGLAASLLRESRERLLARLGLAERNRDAAQIARDRATTRAVALAARQAERTPKQRGSLRGRRTSRRLAAAVARACVGADAEQRRTLLAQLAARRHAADLATVRLPSPWAEAAPDEGASALARQARDQMREAVQGVRARGYPAVRYGSTAGGRVDGEERSPEDGRVSTEHPAPSDDADRLSTDAAKREIERGWHKGLSVRETAALATRAPSFVHAEYVRLDARRGPRPVRGQLSLINGADAPGGDRD